MEIFARFVTLSVTLKGIQTLIHQLLVIRVICGNYYYLLTFIYGFFFLYIVVIVVFTSFFYH